MSVDSLHGWFLPYLASRSKRSRVHWDKPLHLLLCIADHYEPGNGNVGPARARERVNKWLTQYPQSLGKFRDSDGQPPRHSFFYPMEQYVEEEVAALAALTRLGFGEVEIHHHHDRDTPANLRAKLLSYKATLSDQHGLLGRDQQTDLPRYGFVHGDWALNNSLPDGSCCGVNDECTILAETGCYADFTLPSAPSSAQTGFINCLYYAQSSPDRPCGHRSGTPVGSAPQPHNSLMLIQGPLALNWQRPKWGFLPRIENACIQGNQPPHINRLNQWLAARVQVPTQPDWFFVKLHTHGAPEANQPAVIGQPAIDFHQALADLAVANPNFHYHYLTAREMYNLARSAGSLASVTPNEARHSCISPPPAGK